VTEPETSEKEAAEDLPRREAPLIGTGVGAHGAAAALTVLSDPSTVVEETEQSRDEDSKETR
jgi:hypothetical protein